ncbi:MAG: carbohydrate binding domain-containing protein [Elusimicrobiota bacterium]
MKNKLILIAAFILLASSVVLAEDLLITDFDQSSKYTTFVFKDDKGTVWTAGSGHSDNEKGFYLGIKYAIEKGGWGGWGLDIKGLDVSQCKYISFSVKGEKGGENLEVGIKDMKNKEIKVSLKDIATIDTSWTTVKVPLSEFKDIDMSALSNVHFAMGDWGGKGRIFIDDIKFAGGAEEVGGGDTIQGVGKVLVDGFERTNAYDRYYVYEGDDSSLKLASSRFAKEGDYSLELEYTLATTKSLGTWVSAHLRSGVESLNWTGVREIKMWVYGDGSDNILEFNIIDADGDTWVCQDRNVLNQTQWTLISMPLSKFGEKTGKTKVFDPSRIKTFEISVVSKSGVLSPGTRSYGSRIYVDQLYLLGENISAVASTPPNIVERLRMAVPAIGNVDFSGVAFTQYEYSPITQSMMYHWGKLAADAKVDKYSVRLEFAGTWQEFGDSAYYIATASNTTTGGGQEMRVTISDLHVTANDPFPNMTKLTLGNVWLDYSPYTFAGTWGYKGLTAEGDWEDLNYHLFLVKGKYNNFTSGTRLKTTLSSLNLFGLGEIPLKLLGTGIIVYSEDTARMPSLSNVSDSATLNKSNSMKLTKVSQDTTYTLELKRKFFTDRMQVLYIYGANYYSKSADADYSDPFDPKFNTMLETPLTLNGVMNRVRMEIYDIGVKGLSLNGEYRDVDPEFRPKYRNDPNGFDDYESDQKGFNVRASEWYKGFNIAAEYDSIHRKLYVDGIRNRQNYTFGYSGIKGIEMSYYKEIRRDVNNARSERSLFNATNRDEKVVANEVYIRTQIRDNMVLWFKIRNEEFISYAWNGHDFTDTLNAQWEYYLSSNAKFISEYKSVRYRYPNDDNNYLKAYFEVTF